MKRAILFGFIIIVTFPSFAQQTRFISDPQSAFKQAQEFYQKENYSLAYPLLKELEANLAEADKTNSALNYQDIKYYSIVCGLKQNETEAEAKANDFIDLENNEPRVQMMSFHLAEYYFRERDYTSALRLYEHVNTENLNNREIADMKFHEGYGYFVQNRLDLAKPLFNAIRQLPKDPNYLDANYYYGFISFNDKNYNDALAAFKVVEETSGYEKIVPYYIANIYLVQGKKQQALQYAEAKLKKNNQFYDLQMRQLVGNGYYEEQDFARALPYLEQYVQEAPKVTRNDLYELSYCYYQTKNWNKAIDGFKQLGNKPDSLSQNAMYLLGDAYLKTGQKANARNAFLICSNNSSNASQKEIAKFNYAKLSYELGYQDIALNELQDFVKQYPNSVYGAEAKELLVGVLANTSNYKEALALADNLGKTSAATKKLYPRMLYGRATELINDGLLLAANDMLDKALNDGDNNASVLPFLNFWKAEVSYRLNKIEDAIHYYFEYLKSGLADGEANPINAKYNLGYCFLKRENYRQAQGFFEQVARAPKINSEPLEQDAYLRDADCYYMNRDFKTALAMYNKVLGYSWPGSDYATFQKAMIAGVNNGNEKITLLNSISRKYPASGLIPDANMEIATTYLANEQYREALSYLKNIINATGNDALKPRAYLKAGISYYNLNNSAEALNQYDALLKQYPNSPEAQDAMGNAKSIYVEQGRSDEYVNFAKKMGVDVSPSQEDQLAYQEAEVQFNNGNFADAAKKFEQYISKFPDGKYSLEANYYKSEIYYNQKDWAKAVTGYEAVADKAPNKFAEKSILQAAHINFFELKDYANAEKYFIKLKDFATTAENKMEAMRGLLRSQYQLQKWSDATANAQDLLGQKGISTDDRVIANMAIAKSYQSANQCETALQYFRTAASLSKAAYGAEARYEIANCLYQGNQLKDAEKAAFEVINKAGSYELWVTKAYLLLGDVYFKEKDYFNAKATYQSIVENAKLEDLRQQAKQKLNEVIGEEGKNSKVGGDNQ
ncbi:MAG: tetratricopeptide repeat protein [Bacteroidetes bacterium]|nr:tetratricopeptide repeat protein [Bacteroidota bacterium]MBS1973110.1 tetratricopeptide repeat protein [Bacteroidota bacterium]